MGDKAKKKAAFREAVKEKVADWRLSSTDMLDLEKIRRDLDVTGAADDKTVFRRGIYNEAVDAVREGGKLGAEESAELARIQKFLALRDDQLEQTKWDLARLRTLTEIRQGQLPMVATSNVALRGVQLEEGETAHYTVPLALLDQSNTRGMDGMAVGAGFDPAKATSYVLPEDGAKPLGEGTLVVTSRRLLVKTASKMAAVKYSAVGQIFVYADGIRLQRTVGNTLLKYKTKSADTGEIVAEIVAAVTR